MDIQLDALIYQAITALDQMEMEDIINLLVALDDMYSVGESPVSDGDYDSVRAYAQQKEPTNSYFISIGSSVRGAKVKLPFPMGSLDQIYEGDYIKWVSKNTLSNQFVTVTNKLDGISALPVYGNDGHLQIAFSRGNGMEGADITRHVSRIHNVPKKISKSVAVRGEIIMSTQTFGEVNGKAMSRAGKPYKNPRNMVAGLMNSSTNPDFVYTVIDFVAYEIVGEKTMSKREQLEWLELNGFKTVPFAYGLASGMDDQVLTNILKYQRESYEYEIDGLVVDVDSQLIRQKMDPSANSINPAYAVKFKVATENNLAEPTVINVEWNISKDGYLKPRVQVTPVELMGVTVQFASGFNAKFIKENNIGPGAVVRITRAGDVVPRILSVVTPAEHPQMPSQFCFWTDTGTDLVLSDLSSDPEVQFQTLVDFFATINVDRLKDGNLRKMFERGYTTPESIILMLDFPGKIQEIVGSDAIGNKIENALIESLTNIPAYVLMGAHPAFGRGVGTRKMKRLYEAFAGNMLLCCMLDKVLAVKGFEEKTANKVVNGMPIYAEFFDRISHQVSLAEYVSTTDGCMSWHNVVFTGFRDAELQAQIESEGGKISTSVSSTTTLLVTHDTESTSGKAAKARSLGIDVITPEQLKQMME